MIGVITESYHVLAASPEEAAQIVLDGEAGPRHDVLDASVERVVAEDGNWSDDDLRKPRSCRGGCGTMLPARDPDECTPCFLERLNRRERNRRAAS